MKGSDTQSGMAQDYRFDFWGVDAGAKINITNSTFKDSKFCKGLIVYR